MIDLKEKPKNSIIIEGFPGFGYVSTIATEFLIKHLDAKKIGKIIISSITPLAAIHNSKIMDPIEIYYAKKENIVLLRALTNVTGSEWEIGAAIQELTKTLKAKEIISIEGIAAEENEDKEPEVYYYTNQKKDNFKKSKIKILDNGIVVGVTGVLLLKAEELPLSCIFVEAHPGLPDSKAAGEVIKVLDEYLGLDVDYKPLMKTAQEFESKLKELLSSVQKSAEQKERKEVSYLG